MGDVRPSDLHDAVELLEEVRSWSEEAVEQLPVFYRQKAKEYRRQADTDRA